MCLSVADCERYVPALSPEVMSCCYEVIVSMTETCAMRSGE